MSSVDDRRSVLQFAEQAVLADRNKEYDDPENNFAHIAGLWNEYLKANSLTAVDVANMMILVKIARSTTSPTVQDHWADMAGYAACGYAAAMASLVPPEVPGVTGVDPECPVMFEQELGVFRDDTFYADTGRKVVLTPLQWAEAEEKGILVRT